MTANSASQQPISLTLEQALQQGIAHHQIGRLQDAERLYRAILQVQPDHPDANHNLGVLAVQVKQPGVALPYFKAALEVNPGHGQYWLSYIDALIRTGQSENALQILEQGLQGEAAETLDAEARNDLGVILKSLNRLDEAEASLRRALQIRPDLAEAHSNLGDTLRSQSRPDEAEASYRRALAIKPDLAEAHCNLGSTLLDLGRLDEAEACCRRALEFTPDLAEAHYNLGSILKDSGRLKKAEISYRRALEIKPDYADAHCNLGSTLKDLGRLDEAEVSYRRALQIKPDFAEVHYNLGVTLQYLCRLDEAEAGYRQALEIKPDYTKAYSNLLFLHAYHALLSPSSYLDLACAWGAGLRQERRKRSFLRTSPKERRLRVGYVSGDFRLHAVSYFIEQLFKHHDPTRIELFAYTTNGRRDVMTERLQALTEHWIPLMGDTDADARARIEANAIDVLIDLSGHTERNRLGIFAKRAAPVQAHYLGYFASTGLTEMDYWIGDAILTPPESDDHCSEQVWRLPRVWVSYDGKADAPLPAWSPSPDGSVWLGSFNNLGKLSPATLALWAKVLHALPEGRLLLKAPQLSDLGNRRRIETALEQYGIALSRIELQDSAITSDWAAHMAYYNRLDIALDPIGAVGGGTTTCDALWMGVPVVTLEGDRMASRMTASMLDALGRPEWIAHSETEYIETVVTLARNLKLRPEWRLTQRERMAQSPLCDAKNLAWHLENAYFEMFQRWYETTQ